MTEDNNTKHQDNTNTEELNDICDECKNTDESVTQNLILTFVFLELFVLSFSDLLYHKL